MRATSKQNWLELVIISAFFLALSVFGLVWDFTSGLLASGIDGIMFAAVCLLMAVIFAGMLFVELQRAGLIRSFGKKSEPAAVKSAAAKPAAAPVPAKASTATSGQPPATVQTK